MTLIEIRRLADEAGMTLFAYMKANKLLPDNNSPVVQLFRELHRREYGEEPQ